MVVYEAYPRRLKTGWIQSVNLHEVIEVSRNHFCVVEMFTLTLRAGKWLTQTLALKKL